MTRDDQLDSITGHYVGHRSSGAGTAGRSSQLTKSHHRAIRDLPARSEHIALKPCSPRPIERNVQEVVPREALLPHVRALAEEIAGNAPLGVQGIKRTINHFAERGLTESMQFEAASASVLFTSDDMTHGYKAMAEKQDPEFEGK